MMDVKEKSRRKGMFTVKAEDEYCFEETKKKRGEILLGLFPFALGGDRQMAKERPPK